MVNRGEKLTKPPPIEHRILSLRGCRVLVDADLAELYGVSTKRLNEQVKRNKIRFPTDFLFQLTLQEKQEVVANCDHLSNLKYSATLPFVFTEYGAIMAATVLNSSKAIETSVFVVRAFVRLRQLSLRHGELARRIADIENHITSNDKEIAELIKTVKAILRPTPIPPSRQIGFKIPYS